MRPGDRVLVLDANEFRLLEDLADEHDWRSWLQGPWRTLARKLEELR